MNDWDYENNWGARTDYDDWSWGGGSPTFDESGGWRDFLSWRDPTGPGSSGDPNADDGGGGNNNWLSSVLSQLGPMLTPLLRAGTSLAGAAQGAQGANEAARLQTDALTRGMDLQTAQWLQQQANQAPWLQAGREALPQLQQMAQRGATSPFEAPNTPIWGQHPSYAPPSATPGWQPETVDVNAFRWQPGQGPRAQDYTWTPGQGPRAQEYRYTPGQTPDAAQYQSGPPQLYQGAMPGTQVANLTGQQVLDQDPGYQFRQDQARKALEASALAQGMGMSGSTLSALQRQSQDLASQEYGNAYNRMMARDVEQYGRNWGQYQQAWNQGVQGTQLNMATQAQNFGQAMNAAQLREQVNQQAAQQGWSQAQAEAAFREQMAQASSQQGWGQAQQEAAFREQMAQQASQQWGNQVLQTSQWNQGQRQQYETELYNRMLQQAQERYGRDVSQNQQTYDRSLAGYNSRNAQDTTNWNRWAALAGYGPHAAQQLAQGGQAATNTLSTLLSRLGTAQGEGAATNALLWQRGLSGAANELPSILQSLNR